MLDGLCWCLDLEAFALLLLLPLLPPLLPVKSLMSKTECLVLKMFSGFSPVSRTNTDMLPGLLHLIFFFFCL